MNLEIKHLRHFNDALRRDILVDALARPVLIPDKELLARVISYGNAFMERERANPNNANAVIWFDCHFGDPAVVGLTWAYNPHAPFDDLYLVDSFWRLWSEVDGGKPEIFTLEDCQREFTNYTLQHIAA